MALDLGVIVDAEADNTFPQKCRQRWGKTKYLCYLYCKKLILCVTFFSLKILFLFVTFSLEKSLFLWVFESKVATCYGGSKVAISAIF